MLDVKDRGDAVLLSASGEFDLSNSAEFERALERAEATARSLVVLDLSQCRYIDSSIITLIVRYKRRSRRRFAIVANPEGAVHRVFEILRLLKPLGVVATLDEALAPGSS